jgi:hypothetical protein
MKFLRCILYIALALLPLSILVLLALSAFCEGGFMNARCTYNFLTPFYHQFSAIWFGAVLTFPVWLPVYLILYGISTIEKMRTFRSSRLASLRTHAFSSLIWFCASITVILALWWVAVGVF